MIRNLKFLSFLLAFFLGSIFYPLICHASSPVPTPTNSTVELISMAEELITSLMITEHHIAPVTSNLSGFESSMNFGSLPYTDLWNWDSEDFSVSSLSDRDFESLSLALSIYNDLGVEIESSSDIYLIEFDNGFFHGSGYIDSSGNILYSSDNLGGQLLQIAIGGNIIDATQFLDNLEDLADNIIDNDMYLYPSNFNMSERSYYLYLGRKDWRNVLRGYIFVPDMYNQGVCVGAYSSNGHACQYFYTNDLTSVQYENFQGNPIKYYSGNYSYNGYSYSYRIEIPYDILDNSSSDINDLTNGNPGYTVYNLSQTQFVYDSSLLHSDSDLLAFKQLQFPSSSKIVYDPYSEYDYESLEECYSNLNNISYTNNTNFDPSSSLSSINYPRYVNVPDSLGLQSSTIPVPNNDPYLDYDSITQPDSSSVNEALSNYFIPFIENIFDRYPFSIPWDIRDFIKSFQSEPLPPAWDFDWTITIGSHDYTKHFEGDLSDFNGLAQIFRSLMLISFVLFLAKFSYDHHF